MTCFRCIFNALFYYCFQAAEAKKLGNECMKQDKFIEALLHYTKAIKLESEDATLYSNRSLAFLKAQQFFHAKEDAEKVIELKPKWTKVDKPNISTISALLF